MKALTHTWPLSKFLRDKNLINLSPHYQRESGIWSPDRKQLFLDSLFNGFDIPKIYLHRVNRDTTGFDYAVVDGKQRLSSIYEFFQGEFRLADDFIYAGPSIDGPPAMKMLFSELSESARDVLKEVALTVTEIAADDEEEIEEMFFRLNNGEKLNAAESRNALGGVMPGVIQKLSEDKFFTHKLGFPNRRYSHLEVACKLLLIEHNARKAGVTDLVSDLKKKFLDSFVRDNKSLAQVDADNLVKAVSQRLKTMFPIFDDSSIELSKQSFPQLMYIFISYVKNHYGAKDLDKRLKDFLASFRQARIDDLSKPEEDRNWEFAEFGRLMMQGTNDAGSMEVRRDILVKYFLKANPDIGILDPKRAFTPEERWVIWNRANRRCEECNKELAEIGEMDADHLVWHAHGGATVLSNARCLCVSCNRGHGGDSGSAQEA